MKMTKLAWVNVGLTLVAVLTTVSQQGWVQNYPIATALIGAAVFALNAVVHAQNAGGN